MEVCPPQELDFAWFGTRQAATISLVTGLLQQVYLKYNLSNVKLTFFLQGGEYGSTYGSGIYSDQILRFSTNDNKWYKIGKMKEARAYHGMSVVDNLNACKN